MASEAGHAAGKNPLESSRPNLIFISIDTLRADRLGCYGYDSPTSPALDILADQGVRFERVVAESSWTLPSHMTMMTGLYPTTHGVTLPKKRLHTAFQTLAEVLKSNGYRTFANTGGGFIHGRFGFNRGFEMYINKRKPFHKTLSSAKKWIESRDPDEDYFLFIHTYAVHCPYDPPERYARMFRTRPPEDYLETKRKCGNPYYNSMSLTSGQAKFLSDQYDASIRMVDDALKSFFEFLESRDAFGNTIIVFTSDHGEEFYEYGQIGHERTLSLESLIVPLIIVAPDIKPGVVRENAGLADIMPTLLGMLRIDGPRMQGRSLLPLMRGVDKTWKKQPLFSELDRHLSLRSITYEGRHFIFNSTTDGRELYDVLLYPKKQKNLVGDMSDHAKKLEKMLLLHINDLPVPETFLAENPSPEQIQQLRSLGYTN